MALDKMLQFKMGEWSESFDSMAKKPGTVYVTTNEKAMYVDVDDSTRIRIGDIIQLESAKTATPPFSTDALYYFIKENALVKWGPFGENGAMAWKQLNSVSDITTSLEGVTNRVSTLEDKVGILASTDATKDGSVAKAQATADKAVADAAKAQQQADKGVADAEKAQAAADKAQGTADANAETIEGIDERLGQAEGSIAIFGGTGAGSIKEAKDAADAAQADATEALNKIGVPTAEGQTASGLYAKVETAQSTADEAKTAASKNATDISGIDGRLSTAEGKVTTLTTDLGNLTTRVSEAEDDIDELEAYATTLKGADTVDGSVANAKKAGTDAMAKATTNATAIQGIDGRVGTLETTVKTAVDTTIPAIQSKLNTAVDTTIPALEGRVKANEDDIKELQDLLGDSTSEKSVINRLTEVETLVDGQGETIGQLQTAVGENAADIEKLTTDLGTANTNIGKNTTAIGENKSAIEALDATVKGHTTTLGEHKTAIEGLQTTVDNLPNVYVNKTTYAKDQKDLADAIAAQHKTIVDSINAANGMRYVKGITSYDELPVLAEGVEIRVGDTYVVTNENGFIKDTVYYAGDLLVAKGTEVNGVIVSDLDWDHVQTGYVRTHEATMAASAGTDNDVAVKLTSFTAAGSEGGDLGAFVLKGEENIKISMEGQQVAIGMAWGTF